MSTTPYPAGQAIRIPAQLTDSAGTPTDPATLTLTIKLPDGSTANYTGIQLTHDAVGSYHLDYLPGASGHYAYRWLAVSPDAALEGEFDVLPSLVNSDAGQVFGWAGAYLTLPEFKAMPTGVNFDDLIANGSAAANDAELANILLRASRWADNYCTIPLGAHTVLSERQHVRVQRDGNIWISPRQVSGGVPVVSCSRVAYGSANYLTGTVTPPSPLWVEDGAFAVPVSGGGMTSWSGPLQFGPSTPGRLAVEYDYIAGFPITTLAASANAAATSLSVVDATGIQPGQVLRIHDPGVEEPVTVATTWTPTTGTATIPLTSATRFTHSVGAGIGAMPEEIKEAVGAIAIVYIRRSTDTGGGRGPELERDLGADMAAYEEAAGSLLERYMRDGAD